MDLELCKYNGSSFLFLLRVNNTNLEFPQKNMINIFFFISSANNYNQSSWTVVWSKSKKDKNNSILLMKNFVNLKYITINLIIFDIKRIIKEVLN